MKLLTFLIITKFILVSSRKYKLAPVAKNCSLLLPLQNYSQTLILNMDVDAHPELKTCILQNDLSDKTVVIINDIVNISVNETRKIKTNNKPNIIVMTKYFTPKIFDCTHKKFFAKWSLLYIVVTGDSEFKCHNGTMTPNDFLLLDNIMNILWHKFRIMRVGVVFPYACQHKMVIYNGKRRSAQILYDRSIQLIEATNSKDLLVALKKSGEKLTHDYPITGSIFYRYPTAMKDCENLHYYMNYNLNLTDGYCGFDAMVMHDILAYLKFNITYTTDERCNYYGFGVPGNVSGTLGCIIRKDLDISFNSRFMTLYSDEHIYYVHYVKTERLCALVKTPEIKPLWQGVFNLFSPSLWALIGAILVAIGGIMWATATINKTMTGPENMTFWWYLHSSMTTTMVGYSPMKTKTLLTIRSACLLSSIFILAMYQGHISRVYTTVERFPQIKTLKDLYYSGATLYTSSSLREILRQIQNPEDKLQEEFFNKTHLIEGDHDRVGVVLQHEFAATVDRRSDAIIEILEQYTDDDGAPLIDVVEECFITYYLSCVTRSGFPFFEELQVLTQRLNEAGLPKTYYKWTKQILEIPYSLPEYNSQPRAFAKIRLKDQCVAFGILLLGIIVSAVVFAVETWINRRRHLKLCARRS